MEGYTCKGDENPQAAFIAKGICASLKSCGISGRLAD
jgi:hypothetical protein